ncbi:MAG: hypothetical protein A2831_02520 [Candidatus Yanofskybacteria bacterium RIFCSPHIGHO2_01_FULL_44_17]|uniref:CMP/dCMP-type deaminase domain-containing protein n=1 Tax=Candidatus Yanofskybacteria bacterium RIFCSPHIGHO2_01_FULL_44_17 TaxID=1802668 RepID=A0A1F8EVJ6_9BACT|nr:MAG: hypothetical protein A2831_02520 [Candidatus Yanofskybacteria bacterium RIFCSPHIGHO2_01_FULL_44_17]
MLKLNEVIEVEILKFSELSALEKTLLERAFKVHLKAQAPYSHFQVGCSLATTFSTKLFDGCNIENANWSETGHAEENAISAAVCELGPCPIKELAVIGAMSGHALSWPIPELDWSLDSTIHLIGKLRIPNLSSSCGSCLQKIAENCFDDTGLFDPHVPLLVYDVSKKIIFRTSIGNAYPMPFLPQHLGVNYAKDPRVILNRLRVK